jgi:hypothetical protein
MFEWQTVYSFKFSKINSSFRMGEDPDRQDVTDIAEFFNSLFTDRSETEVRVFLFNTTTRKYYEPAYLNPYFSTPSTKQNEIQRILFLKNAVLRLAQAKFLYAESDQYYTPLEKITAALAARSVGKETLDSLFQLPQPMHISMSETNQYLGLKQKYEKGTPLFFLDKNNVRNTTDEVNFLKYVWDFSFIFMLQSPSEILAVLKTMTRGSNVVFSDILNSNLPRNLQAVNIIRHMYKNDREAFIKFLEYIENNYFSPDIFADRLPK